MTGSAATYEFDAETQTRLPARGGVSCIYTIRQVGTDRLYVGSARDHLRRWYAHRRALTLGNHRNRILQRIWNKFGPAGIVFSIVEFVEASKLLEREQAWIDSLQPQLNLYPIAGRGPAGTSLTPEHRAKIGAAQRGRKRNPEEVEKAAAANRGKKRSPEVVAQMAEARRGKKASQAHRENISKALLGKPKSPEAVAKTAAAHRGAKRSDAARLKMSKRYILTSPTGEEVVVINLAQFCRENSLSRSNLLTVITGKRSHSKGWIARKECI